MNKNVKIIFVFVVWLLTIKPIVSQIITWEKINYNPNANLFYSVQQLTDGNYIVAGTTRINSRNRIYVIKYNIFGDTLFAKIFETNDVENYAVKWIEETTDKGFIITGYGSGPQGDSYLVRMDSVGNVIWFKNYGGNNLDVGYCVKQTLDKGFILLSRSVNISEDMLLTKTDSIGNVQWEKVIDSGYDDYPGEVELVSNKGYIVIGSSNRSSNLIRFNLEGEKLWQKDLDSISASSISMTSQEGYILGGVSGDNGIYSSSILKTDSSGNELWQKKYNTYGYENIFSVKEIKNSGGFVFCGWSDTALIGWSKRAMYKVTDIEGNILNQKFFSPGEETSRFLSVSNTSDGGFIFAGIAGVGIGFGYLIKTDSLGNTILRIKETEDNTSNDFLVYQNFPNPFNGSTNIIYQLKRSSNVSISIYNILGKLVYNKYFGKISAGVYSFNFNSMELSTGVYYYAFNFGNQNIVHKFLILK